MKRNITIDDVVDFMADLSHEDRVELFISFGKIYPYALKMSQLTASERKFYSSKLKRG